MCSKEIVLYNINAKRSFVSVSLNLFKSSFKSFQVFFVLCAEKKRISMAFSGPSQTSDGTFLRKYLTCKKRPIVTLDKVQDTLLNPLERIL